MRSRPALREHRARVNHGAGGRALGGCPGVTVCPTAARLWARVRNLQDNGTHREYLEAYHAYWAHECDAGH